MTERPDPRSIVAGALAVLALAALSLAAGCEREETASDDAAPGVTGIRYLAAEDDAAAGYAQALEPRPFAFPADHASHPRFRTEWWYFTGNVVDARERHYGFELTIFRIALRPVAAARESPLAASQIWMANLAVTDTSRELFQAAERLSRGAPGLAGVAAGSGRGAGGAAGGGGSEPIVVAIEDWSATIAGDEVRLSASDDGFGIELALAGLDRIVRQGTDGLDPKGPEPGNASYYYSAPRLAVTGAIASGGAAPVAVTGTAWMDREWSTSALSPDVEGWDWFALQLDDGRDLMFYRLRGRDGGTSPYSGGSIADAAGNVTRLAAGDVELQPTGWWTSERTGVRYPVEWSLAVPAERLELRIVPRLERQELDLTVRYWEGAVVVTGRADAEPAGGVGYLELAGY